MMSDFNFPQLKSDKPIKAICSSCSGEVVIRKEDSIKIGKYLLIRQSDDTLWISCPSGEGGQFDPKKLEKVIDKFYADNF